MISLTPGAELASKASRVAPSSMRAGSSYAISATDPDGYTRTVTRNIVTQDHASTTINELAATGWTGIDLYPESF